MAGERAQRRLTAILAADVAGYSRLMGADEEGTLAQLKAHRKELIDPTIQECRGRIVKTTGDGLLVEFGSVVDAVRCAAEIQEGMRARTSEVSPEKRIQFRIGIHVGDIIIDGDDIYGDGVNIAARLEGIAAPGGICVSSAVYNEVSNKVDLKFDDSGDQVLKNIARPVRVYKARMSGGPPPKVRSASPKPRGSALRTAGIVGALVAAVIVLVLFLGIPANFLVNALQGRIESATGYRLRIDGGASIGLLPTPSVSLRQIVLTNDNEPGVVRQFKADKADIALSFAGLLSGKPHITDVTVTHPVFHLPLARDRVPWPSNLASASSGNAAAAPTIDRITVKDGQLAFFSSQDHLESSIDRINVQLLPGSRAEGPHLFGSLYWLNQPLQIELKAQRHPQDGERRTIPVEVTLQFPGLSQDPVSALAEVQVRNSSVAINSLSGRFGDHNFNGWANLDLSATKTLLTGDVDFDSLRIAPDASKSDATNGDVLNAPWSDQEFDFRGLNFIDADLRISAETADFISFRIAPLVLEANLSRGVLRVNLSKAEMYGGQAKGVISLDASAPVPALAVQVRLDGVNSLALLSDVAGFEHLEGGMHANVDVNGTGASEQAVISTLAGQMDFQLANGAIRGIDISKLVHSLTSTILDGWQQNAEDKTELSAMHARFRIASGIATIDDLELAGPIVRVTGTGTIDFPQKTLDLKVDPRLTAGAAGLGVPVAIQGSWSKPRIYPDVAGILDNPENAFSQLKAAGKGLFGDSKESGPPLNSVFEGIGKMFNGPAANRRGLPGGDQ